MLEVVPVEAGGAAGPPRRRLPLSGRRARAARRLPHSGLIALGASAALLGLGCTSLGEPASGRSAGTSELIGVAGSSPPGRVEPSGDIVGLRPEAVVVRSGEIGAAAMAADPVANDGPAPAGQPVAAAAPGPRAAAIGAHFVLIQPETFSMGSPADEPGRWTDETRHPVTLTQAFHMQITEVSQGQWKEIVGNNPAFHQDAGEAAPVEMVSWWEAAAYANAMSSAEGLPKCYDMTGCSATPGKGMTCAEIAVTAAGGSPYDCAGYRLPTEAEWECAYRAGSTTAFFNGPIAHTGFEPVDPNLNAIGWYWGNSGGTTRSAGLKAPNARGLFDLAGNVWEWVWDRYDAAYPGDAVTDPLGPRLGDHRVARGGSFNSGALYERAAARGSARPDRGGSDLGFRLVRTGP